MSKDDYLAASRGLQVGYGPTQDFTDPAIGATAQTPGGIPAAAEGLPGQVFAVEQLPDPRIAQASGFVPSQIPGYLIIEGDDIGKHTQGPTPAEIQGFKLQADLGHPVISFDGQVRSTDDALKAFNDTTGPNAQARRGLGADTDNSVKDDAPRASAPAASPFAPPVVSPAATPVVSTSTGTSTVPSA